MVENKSSLFGIIAIIIGASGLGLGAFSVVNFQVVEGPQGDDGQDGQDGIEGTDGLDGINGTDGIDGVNGSLGEVVGIWNKLSNWGLPSIDYRIELDEIIVNNSKYFYLSELNTNIHLIISGWYRVSLRFLWEGLVSGIIYELRLYKNGAFMETLLYYYHAISDQYYHVSSFAYIWSNGDDAFYFNCIGSGSFSIYPGSTFGQLAIEYMGI